MLRPQENHTASPADTGIHRELARLPAGFLHLHVGHVPILAAAVHAGHRMDAAYTPYLAADDAMRRREEDPLTDFIALAAGCHVLVNQSRFEADLNRPPHLALSSDPADTWGLRFWKERPPDRLLARSRGLHNAFFRLMQRVIEQLIERHGVLLVLDIHSYNAQRSRAGRDGDSFPDIDVGITEIDMDHWQPTVEHLVHGLRAHPMNGRALRVAYNERYPDGGHFPKWVHANFDCRVGVVTLEYKKVFMDERTARVDLTSVTDLRAGLAESLQHLSLQQLLSAAAR